LNTIKFKNVLSDIRKRYCPYRGFTGQFYCPTTRSFQEGPNLYFDLKKGDLNITSNGQDQIIYSENFSENVEINENIQEDLEFNDKLEIRSGFGFDRVRRVMKFPVFISSAPEKVPTTVHHKSEKYESVRDFLYEIHQQKGTYPGGLYVSSEPELRDLAMKFGDYRVAIGATQRTYITHKTSVKANAIDEFKQIVDLLPKYDKNNPASKQLYDLFIDYFGTEATISSDHGGIVYQQVAVKTCYGGSITADMLNDIDSLIRRIPPNNAYLKFRQLGATNILGGNPEFHFNRINERIESFEKHQLQ